MAPDEDGKFEIAFIVYSLDAKSGCLIVQHAFTGLENDENEVKQVIAAAIAQNVPLYPNDQEAATHLERLHAALLSDGFEAKLGGRTQRLYWAGKSAVSYDQEVGRWEVEPTQSVFPIDAVSIARKANERQRSVSEAMRVLAQMRAAISELSSLLDNDVRDEARLQTCLTQFPVLFGMQYQERYAKPLPCRSLTCGCVFLRGTSLLQYSHKLGKTS